MADHGHDRETPTSPFLYYDKSLILLDPHLCVWFISNNLNTQIAVLRWNSI